MTIEQLIRSKETEHKIEFKSTKGGNFSYTGGTKLEPKERRKCILGYVVAFANEGGGYLVFGMGDKEPHEVVGTEQSRGGIGKLEQSIYTDLRIRVKITELFDENEKRVLVIEIPNRPTGKVYKFEDVALMRVGEQLLPMSDEQYLKIIQEREPDFSQEICKSLTINDLDSFAIQKMKEAYSNKHNNDLFLQLTDEQALSDLELFTDGKLNYAALILLGKTAALKKYLPQAKIYLEYRNINGQITFDNRDEFQEAFFLMIDRLWNIINLRNGKVPVQQGAYIFDIPYFNQEVIREAINNAVAHRDYRRTSEIVIKQYPTQLIVINPGGFPIGVTLQNLLTVSSTPRNRRLADVLAKTGIVERSGQGIDKIFYQSLSESKPAPDYSASDDFQVELTLSAVVEDKIFALFIRKMQRQLKEGEKLSVNDIIALNKIRKNEKPELPLIHLQKLERNGLIERVSNGKSPVYRLSLEYYVLTDQKAHYFQNIPAEDEAITFQVVSFLAQVGEASMKDLAELLKKYKTRDQTRYLIQRLVELDLLEKTGSNKDTRYSIGKKMKNTQKMLERIMELGIAEMQKRGEMPPPA